MIVIWDFMLPNFWGLFHMIMKNRCALLVCICMLHYYLLYATQNSPARIIFLDMYTEHAIEVICEVNS